MTQAGLAQAAAVATTLVGRAERGQAVSDTTLKALARTLQIPDETITPHLTETPTPTARVDPGSATWGDLRRELAWWHGRLRDSPEDYQRLLYLLELSAQLEDSPVSTQGGAQVDAQG